MILQLKKIQTKKTSIREYKVKYS